MQEVTKKFDFTIFIGRFQPVHIGHLRTIRLALKCSNKLVLIIGSYQCAPSVRNPWSAKQRIKMLLSCLSLSERKKIVFIPIRDRIYSEFAWNQNIFHEISKIKNLSLQQSRIGLIGHNKDASSYYLKNFPDWDFLETGNYQNINSTDFRKHYFSNSKPDYKIIPSQVKSWLKSYKTTKEYQLRKEEFLYVQKAKENNAMTNIMEGNCLILNGNYILTIKRENNPGKFLFALPGGQLNNKENTQEGALRLLKEQTNFELEKDIPFQEYIYNHPERNPIARTKAQLFFYHLHFIQCPKVTTGGDAHTVQWILLDELSSLETEFYADHYQIIQLLLGRIHDS